MIALGIGICAALLTSASFGAQAWKTWRTRDTGALATSAWIFTTLAFALWTTYGVLHREWPIILPNAFCFVLAGFILALKLMPLDAATPRRSERSMTHHPVVAKPGLGGVRWRRHPRPAGRSPAHARATRLEHGREARGSVAQGGAELE